MPISRDAVLDAAARHLAADPGASMAEIADAAGVGRATLHRLVAGRDALLEELAARALAQTAAALDAAGIEDAPPAEAIAMLVAALAPVAHLYGFLIAAERLAGVARLDAADRAVQDRLEAFFRRGQAAGAFRPDLPPRWLALSLGALLALAGAEIQAGYLAPREAAARVLAAFLHGAGGLPA